MTTTGNNKHEEEPEITVETPPPIPVEPHIATNCVATPVDIAHEIGTTTTGATVATSQLKPSTCTVFAPATLSAGYTFPARVDDIDFVVTVPDGGVIEGQAFQVPYPSHARPSAVTPLEVAMSHTIPTGLTGKWRNGVWDCCEVFPTEMFWQALCCTPILLGQIMTRNHLNPCNLAENSRVSYCHLFTGMWVFCLAIWVLSACGIIGGGYVILIWLAVMIVTALTRNLVRKKYQIPIKCCDGFDGFCDDICCGAWCACCVSIQMARHTHPEDEFSYYCCSTTGLAPDIV